MQAPMLQLKEVLEETVSTQRGEHTNTEFIVTFLSITNFPVVTDRDRPVKV